LQKQRDTYKKIGQKWEKAKATSVSSFLKIVRTRQMAQRGFR
jgi:hypothetical protein